MDRMEWMGCKNQVALGKVDISRLERSKRKKQLLDH